MLARFGIETTYYDPAIGADIESLMRPNTKLVHTEAPGSNTFEMQDIPAIAEVAHAHGALVSMDNTWATPLLLQAARSWRRHFHSRRHQIPGRSFGRPDRHGFGQ
jgi:cystathionine beta-lyase